MVLVVVVVIFVCFSLSDTIHKNFACKNVCTYKLSRCADPCAFLLFYNMSVLGVSNHWTGIRNGSMEWKMELNSEHMKLQLTRVTGADHSRVNYLLVAMYLTAENL